MRPTKVWHVPPLMFTDRRIKQTKCNYFHVFSLAFLCDTDFVTFYVENYVIWICNPFKIVRALCVVYVLWLLWPSVNYVNNGMVGNVDECSNYMYLMAVIGKCIKKHILWNERVTTSIFFVFIILLYQKASWWWRWWYPFYSIIYRIESY